MPNRPIVSGIIILSSVLLAAGFAVYDNPQVREWADQTRRKIALVLHSLGDEIATTPAAASAENVEDEDERRRQARQELMERNRREWVEKRQFEQQQEKETRFGKTLFDDFLAQDRDNPDKGTLVYSSSSMLLGSANNDHSEIRHRSEGLRGLDAGMSCGNPFIDENEEATQMLFDRDLIGVDEDEKVANTRDSSVTLGHEDQDLNTSSHVDDVTVANSLSVEEMQHESMTSHETDSEALSRSISNASSHSATQEQSAYYTSDNWNPGNGPAFYSPLPMTPTSSRPHSNNATALHDGENILTPTDSISLAGSGEDVGAVLGSDVDILSDDGIGASTPDSWTEVGSIVSEGDGVHHQ